MIIVTTLLDPCVNSDLTQHFLIVRCSLSWGTSAVMVTLWLKMPRDIHQNRSKMYRYCLESDCCNKALLPGRAEIDIYPELCVVTVTVSAGAAAPRVNHHSWSRRHQHDICWHPPRLLSLAQIDTRNCRQGGGGLQPGILLGSPEQFICIYYEWMNLIVVYVHYIYPINY